MDVNLSLAESYEHCRRVTRAAGSSFYYPLWLLPPPRRRAMHAFYAFCRIADDIGDGPDEVSIKRERLAAYRDTLERALDGAPATAEFPALVDTVRTYEIPRRYLFEILDGVAMDLTPRSYANWGELQTYCYHVAGAVGLACLAIWGGHVPEAHAAAVRCGEAFQLTNIVRDVRDDARNGRVYLPRDDMAEFGVTVDALSGSGPREPLRRLILRQVERAKAAFADSAALTRWIPRESQGVYRAMWRTYRALLAKIERREGDVFSRRVRLSRAEKLWIVASSWRGTPRLAERAR
jgi:phytoene synthase